MTHSPRGSLPISRALSRPISRPGTKPVPRQPTGASPVAPIAPVAAETYRPRGGLAAAILIAPACILLALAASYLISGDVGLARLIVLGAGSGMAFGWLFLTLACSRILLVTVRTSSEGLIANYPIGKQRVLRWQLIDHVDRQLGFVRMHSSDGQALLFVESGLTNGQRLLRQTLLRASPAVLSGTLQQELALLGGGLFRTAYQPPTPRLSLAPGWFFLAGLAGVIGAGLAGWGTLIHAGALLGTGVGIGLVGVICLMILRQTITITDTGVTIDRGLGGPVTLSWSEIKLIEESPLAMMQALRGEKRVVFIGMFFMAPSRRDIFLAALSQHLTRQGIPVMQRWFIV